MKKIGIVMGSDSDLPVVEKAMATLEKFGVPFEANLQRAQGQMALVPSLRQRERRHIWQVPWRQIQPFP